MCQPRSGDGMRQPCHIGVRSPRHAHCNDCESRHQDRAHWHDPPLNTHPTRAHSTQLASSIPGHVGGAGQVILQAPALDSPCACRTTTAKADSSQPLFFPQPGIPRRHPLTWQHVVTGVRRRPGCVAVLVVICSACTMTPTEDYAPVPHPEKRR